MNETEYEVGDVVRFKPPSGGHFPDGSQTRRAEIENIRDGELIVRQLSDGFTDRINPEQIVK